MAKLSPYETGELTDSIFFYTSSFNRTYSWILDYAKGGRNY